jgi:hypothetical protein
MRKNISRRGTKALGAVVAAGLVSMVTIAGATPALASEDIPPSTLELITSANPASEQGAVEPALKDAGAEDYVADIAEIDVSVSVPVDPAAGIDLDQGTGNTVTVGLPNASNAGDGVVDEDGLVHYDNQDGSTTVPLVREDGELQITTLIKDASAPSRYEYPITVAEGGQLVDAGDGFFAVLDAAGQPAATIAPAWATDVNGREVPTRYEQVGNTLVQIVEHSTDYAYPIVADPAVRGNLITSVFLKWSSYGVTVSVTPRSGWAITTFDKWWAEYKLWVSSIYEGGKFYDQLRCHVDTAPFKSPWNLDDWRPDVSYTDTLAAFCNP